MNKSYQISVKFNAHSDTEIHTINAKLCVMMWESPATLYDAAECEIVGISLESFDSGHHVVNEGQSEQLENVINDYLYENFSKYKSDYILPSFYFGDNDDV